jgi:hypothetical protein
MQKKKKTGVKEVGRKEGREVILPSAAHMQASRK